jgi:hypothetical protein
MMRVRSNVAQKEVPTMNTLKIAMIIEGMKESWVMEYVGMSVVMEREQGVGGSIDIIDRKSLYIN